MKRQVSLILTLTFTLFAAAAAAAKSPGACELLSREDVKAAQGQAFDEAKLTMSRAAGTITTQCFYRLPAFVDSISLAVIHPASPSTTADELWKTLAGPRTNKMTGKGRRPAQEISGLGDEAFWAGNRNAGALYVLQGHNILRISVGGGDTEEKKIEKTRQLAAAALVRLSP